MPALDKAATRQWSRRVNGAMVCSVRMGLMLTHPEKAGKSFFLQWRDALPVFVGQLVAANHTRAYNGNAAMSNPWA